MPVSLRLIVVIPLILQVVATVGLTGWLSWRNSNRTVHDLTNQLIEQAIARVEQRVETFGFASDNLPPKANEQTPLTVAEMRMFLQGLNFTELGLIAIVEGSGKIIATSLPELSNQTSETPETTKLSLAGAIEYLQVNHQPISGIKRSQSYSFEIDGRRQLLQVTPIANDRGLDWFVLVVVPAPAFVEPIGVYIQTTVFLGVAGLGLAMCISVIISELIRRPLRQFSDASRAIAQGKLGQSIDKIPVKELTILADDFNQMSQQVSESFDRLSADYQKLSKKLVKTNEAVEREKNDRQIVEQQLHTSEQKMRAVFEAMNDIVIVLDTDGNIEVAPTNPGVLYDPDTDIISLTIEHLFDADNFVELQSRIQEVLESKQTINFDYSLKVESDARWFAARMSPMSGNSAIWVARDISDRKKTELALHMAQQKSESLLLNILPETIAEQLKQSPEAIAEHFDEVTILFSDIVGFTPLSARLSAIELVNLLNYMFSKFDQLAEKYRLEKIKTIGDAYMVAAGLPLHRHDHADAIAEMALDMQVAIEDFSREQGEEFQIRIGIHSGPVVAGVIGMKKFIYDLWGDTVNVASRMESSGAPGKIQLTTETYQLLKDRYILAERGQISVKGKGEMITYWLVDRK